MAIRCQGRETTYAQLLDEIYRAQCALADLGIEAGQRVALVLRDDEAFPAWFLGALRSGVVPIPLSTMLTGPELGPIVADAGAVAVVMSDAFIGTVGDIVAADSLGLGFGFDVVFDPTPAPGNSIAAIENPRFNGATADEPHHGEKAPGRPPSSGGGRTARGPTQG